MHQGFYCGADGSFYIPKPHRLSECCYDGSHSGCRHFATQPVEGGGLTLSHQVDSAK
jgi:hypothetical protein